MTDLKNYLKKGMGIGGWLTNYKRFNVLPPEHRMKITVGDMEHFASFITENDVKYIASLGFDHIRLGFDQIVIEQEPYKYRKEIVDILHNFWTWCDKYNLKLVLNMHKAIGNYCDILDETGLMQSQELQDRFIAVWTMLENEFSGIENIAFELLNEVVNATAEEWNSLAEKTVNAIRKLNKDRIIVVGGVNGNSPAPLAYLRVFDDDRIIYTYHCYEPYEFTHQQGVLQAGPLYYNRKMPYPCDDIEIYCEYRRLMNEKNPYVGFDKIDIEFMRNYMMPAKEFIERNPDKTLWCGEFGTIRHCNIKYRENWMRDIIKILGEWGIPYCVWNYLSTPNDGNRFSLVDDDTRLVLSQELERIITGKEQ